MMIQELCVVSDSIIITYICSRSDDSRVLDGRREWDKLRSISPLSATTNTSVMSGTYTLAA